MLKYAKLASAFLLFGITFPFGNFETLDMFSYEKDTDIKGESIEVNEWLHLQNEQNLGENEEVNKVQNGEGKEIKLTDDQVAELEKLVTELFEKRKELISKYVEFGVLDQEKADAIFEHMDRHLEKLKESQYIPKFEKKEWGLKKKEYKEKEQD